MRLAGYDFPMLVVDNFLSENQLIGVWNEIDALDIFMKDPAETGSARDANQNLKKKNKACWIDQVYGDARHASFILSAYSKIFSPEFFDEAHKLNWFFDYLPHTNYDSTLLSVYENGDMYKPHCDTATITTLIWLWKEPRAFTGGDMIFQDQYHFPIHNNMLVMFPSCIKHEVTEVKMEDKPGFGRYVITNFAQLR